MTPPRRDAEAVTYVRVPRARSTPSAMCEPAIPVSRSGVTAGAFGRRDGRPGAELATSIGMIDPSDTRVPEGDIPIYVDPSRGYRAANLELAQGVYFLVTGLWPLISPTTFQAVTGRKRELWLVNTVGALAAVVGGVLTYAGARRRRPSEVAMLAMGTSAAFAAIDITYVLKRRISQVYLVDAAAQIGLLALWTFARGHLPWRLGRDLPDEIRLSPEEDRAMGRRTPPTINT
jgi:hypothetical protein